MASVELVDDQPSHLTLDEDTTKVHNVESCIIREANIEVKENRSRRL